MKKNIIYSNELYLKIIHTLSLLYPLFYPYFDFVLFSILISFSLFFICIIEYSGQKNTNIQKYLYKIFSKGFRNYERKNIMGATYMIVGFFIISFIFNKNIVITSMMITSLSDASAALFGLKCGKISTFNNKTLEGSTMFALTSFFSNWNSLCRLKI